jgi:teichuronic acid exporter
MVFLSFISIFTSFGFSTAIIQRPYIDDQYIKTAQTLSLGIGISSTFIMAISAHWIGAFYNNPSVERVIPAMSLIFVFSSFTLVPTALLTRKMQFKKITITSFVGSLIYGISALYLAYTGFGVWSLVVGPVFSLFVSVILLSYAANYYPRFGLDKKSIKELIDFGGFVTISSLLNHVARNIDNLIIGRYLGAELLGLYARAYNLATIPKEILMSVFGSVLFPSFARLQDDNNRLKAAYFKSINAISLISLPISAIFATTAPELINTVYGSKWTGAIVPLQILSLAGFFYSLYVPMTSLLLGLGKTKIYAILQVIYSSSIVFLVLISYRNGIEFVSIAVFLAIFICFFKYLYAIHATIKTPVTRYFDSLKVAIVSTLIMVFFVVITKFVFSVFDIKYSQVLFAVELVISVVVYSICVANSKDEVATELLLLLKKKINKILNFNQ